MALAIVVALCGGARAPRATLEIRVVRCLTDQPTSETVEAAKLQTTTVDRATRATTRDDARSNA